MSGISLGRPTVALLLGRLLGYALSLVSSVLLARALGPDRLGAYAYAMGLTGIFGLLPNLGIGTIVTRTIARDPRGGGGILGPAVRAQALLATGVLLLIPAAAALLPEQPVPLTYVALAAAQLALGSLSWPYLAVLGGRARFDRLAAAELLTGAIGTGLVLAVALLRGGVSAFLWAHVLAAGLCLLVARRVSLPLLPPAAGVAPRVGALLREGGPFGAGAAVQSLYTRLDLVMLGQMASRATLGLYSAAYKPITLATYCGSTVAGTLFPLLAQEPHRGTPTAFLRAMRGLGVAGPALALALTGLAAPLLHLLYGASFVPAAPMVALLAWSVVANWLYAPLGTALQARGQERAWLGGLLGATILNAAGNLWAIPRWGGLGAAGATLASETFLLAAGLLLAGRRLAIRPGLRPILAVMAASGLGLGILELLAGLGPLGATGAALGAYGLILAGCRLVTREDAALVLGWIREASRGWSGR